MESEILFSIVMPTFNRGDLIQVAIDSVLRQSYQNWELLIIDDGSKDNTRTVVESNKDKRIKYFFQENQERSAARNNGVRRAKGDYICFLESDDYYLEIFLIEFYLAIEKNDFSPAFYFCNTFRDNGSGVLEESPLPDFSFQLNYDFLLTNTIGTPRVCLPSGIAKKNPFDLSIKNGEDFELWIRLIGDLKVIHVSKYTQVFLDHSGRSINEEEAVQSAISLREQVLRTYQNKFSKQSD